MRTYDGDVNMIAKEEIVVATKWAAIVSHIKNNRIEYLVLLGLCHLFGVTTRVYSEVQGVCL